jgi:hypothetical protein
MRDGPTKQRNTVPRCITKPEMIVQPAPVMEVTLEFWNAEAAIEVTESGRVSVVSFPQSRKRRSGIFVNCDGASNLTDFNLLHFSNTEFPRIETEKGTLNDFRYGQLQNA